MLRMNTHWASLKNPESVMFNTSTRESDIVSIHHANNVVFILRPQHVNSFRIFAGHGR